MDHKLNTFHSGLNSDAGNPEKDSCTFILQHHPSAAKLTNIAGDWLDKFNKNNLNLKKKFYIPHNSQCYEQEFVTNTCEIPT